MCNISHALFLVDSSLSYSDFRVDCLHCSDSFNLLAFTVFQSLMLTFLKAKEEKIIAFFQSISVRNNSVTQDIFALFFTHEIQHSFVLFDEQGDIVSRLENINYL